ncbi:hypothetical protein JTB14_035533 [Gonioctena quinquepunctata]|nr:hypothetical protein JTB14_035533 [Gonioctena quinquepunctata]
MADLKEIKTNQRDLVDSVEYRGLKIDNFSKKIDTSQVKVEAIPIIESNVLQNSSEISKLKYQIDIMEQQSKMNNIIINGIPESRNENIMKKDVVTLSVTDPDYIGS